MDSHEPAAAAAAAVPELSNYEQHAVELTGHVSQPDRDTQLSHSLFPSTSLSPSSPHPFNFFDFPTLEDDGSVSDLATHQPPPTHYSTPPAALSALGNKSMADHGYASESEASLADQYDMIDPDDLSEISNDDHDTASITSNDHDDDGQLIPELADSDEEEEDGHDEDQFEADDTVSQFSEERRSLQDMRSKSSTDSVVMVESTLAQQVKAENELIDSYMSDDLETPRQSTMPFTPTSAVTRIQEPTVSFKVDRDPSHILFVSSRDIRPEDMDLIVSRITAAVRTTSPDSPSNSHHKVIRLPPTPTGISPASATVVCGQDNISGTVQHCIGAERRTFGSYAMRVLDHDGEHSSWFTVGPDGKIDIHKPDIAIFHIRNYGDAHLLSPVLEAIESMKVSAFIILEKEAEDHASFRRASSMKLVVKAADFIGMSRSALTGAVSTLITRASPSKGPVSFWERNSMATKGSRLLLSGLPLILLLLVTTLLAYSPAVDIPARREALDSALVKVPTSLLSNCTTIIDVNHLLPTLPPACYTKTIFGQLQKRITPECKSEPRFQALQPNNMVLSLPGDTRYPYVVSSKVFKADGRNVFFSTTQLIDGVWLITFDRNEAYDTITLNMVTEKPAYNITASHYYGKRFLKRKTYENAGTEVSKMVGSDIAIMSKAVQKINDLIATEVAASMQATRNFTSQLAKYMTHELQVVSRELQVFGKTANSMLHKAGRTNGNLTKSLMKDLVVIQKDLVKFTQELSVSVKSTVELAKSNTKAMILSPLALSRQRVQGFKQAFNSKKDDGKAQKVEIAAKEASGKRAAEQQKAKQKVMEQLQQKAHLETRLRTAQLLRKKAAMERQKVMDEWYDVEAAPDAGWRH